MKRITSSLLALVATVVVSHAQADDQTVYYSGSLQISEITVVRDGVTTTYDVPQALASRGSFSSDGTSLGFGPSSKCAPYLGDIATDVTIPVTGLTAVRYEKIADSWESKKISVDVAASGTIVVPKGANVYGTCGSDGKTLTELGIQTRDDLKIRLQTK